jgi:hypothetical protein
VDFLHQFSRDPVSKKDKAAFWTATGCRAGGHWHAETGFSGVPGCSRKNAPGLIRGGKAFSSEVGTGSRSRKRVKTR